MSVQANENLQNWLGDNRPQDYAFRRTIREVNCAIESSKQTYFDSLICMLADPKDFPITVSSKKGIVKYK